jgi:DNA-binding transcriptional ArsR family regulator
MRLLHVLLSEGELCAGDIARALGMKPQTISNQLQRLSDLRIVSAERRASEVHYRIADPCLPILLDKALCLVEQGGRDLP